MKTIWKYPVPFHTYCNHMIPNGARILSVQAQDGHPMFWAEVEPDRSVVPRSFVWVGTGHPVDENLEYVATLQDGHFVWHLYEMKA